MQPEKVIQNYKVTHLVGSGGMGEVWAGKHLYMDRKVAIKALHPSLVSNPEIRMRFKQEAVTLSQLDHPNIVRLYDYIEEEDGVFLVMEYVEGDTLDHYILRKTGPIPEEPAKQLFMQMLAGLQYAHAAGVIHRDLKPSNFMVTRDQRIKILDFGIAKALEKPGHDRTKTGMRIGTVLYMSPEQVRGEQLDRRSDIYSMGVTLFQMLTGRCPYASQATEYEIYQQIVNDPLPRAASFYPAVSAHMQAVIDRATAKQAAARYRDCAEFLASVQGVAPSTPAAAVPPAQAQRPAAAPPVRRRSKLGWTVRMLVVLLLLGGAGGAAYLWGWPLLHREIVAASQRTPSVVALEFLNAMERSDYQTAYHLGNPECRAQLDLFRLVHNRGRGRLPLVLEESTLGTHATVEYHYQGDPDRHSIELRRRHGMWEVDCRSDDLW